MFLRVCARRARVRAGQPESYREDGGLSSLLPVVCACFDYTLSLFTRALESQRPGKGITPSLPEIVTTNRIFSSLRVVAKVRARKGD